MKAPSIPVILVLYLSGISVFSQVPKRAFAAWFTDRLVAILKKYNRLN
jgi:hypothetical protein